MDVGTQLARSHEIGIKINAIFQKRAAKALENFKESVNEAVQGDDAGSLFSSAAAMLDPWSNYVYGVDAVQRSVLFWNTLYERGNHFVKNVVGGLKPVLRFDYDIILDGRTLSRPVNYALLRIKPPEGVTIDPDKRPYLIIDPRAGHGPGIGGFKEDSEAGVAMRAGHPVYFVIFFRDPEPEQTLLDVCAAEKLFVKKVRSLHPKSAKPTIMGNCQGGWAAMMLAASSSEDTGPVVINGAPMSYWGGAWSEGESDNPMRYTGGILGGSWLASLFADLGNGKFDGAHLVQNFENLNPANSLWDKLYNLYRNVDTEAPRYLDFERWWGGYYLMNREEIEWIVRNLFVGNKLWSGDVKDSAGKAFDLREIKAPIILFASMGDNITPPQQAFNWVTDIYGTTEDIKAHGQTIVGLMHKDIGHLGIFVSGKVAKKEHSQIVSALDEIEILPPGLYGMKITERKGKDGTTEYDVEFKEYELEEVASRLNRFKREDEKPFEAVMAVSDFNQRAYELFAQPIVQMMSSELSATLMREFHPLRFQQWAISSMNPWLSWLPTAAAAVKEHRREADADQPLRSAEGSGSKLISASLEFYRAIRDAATEATFFAIYANMFSTYLAEKHEAESKAAAVPNEARNLAFIKDALSSVAEGGYTEAFARVAYMLSRKGEPLPISKLETRNQLIAAYSDYVPKIPLDQWRRIRGEQEIIVRYDPEQALGTLPSLLADQDDREKLLTLLEKLMKDERVQHDAPTPGQIDMLGRIRGVLNGKHARPNQPRASRSAHAAR